MRFIGILSPLTAIGRRLANRPLEWPSTSKANGDHPPARPHSLRPSGESVGNPAVGKPAGGPLIVRLLALRCPSAVAWLVMTVVVDSVKRVPLRWFRSHVLQECLKGLLPESTDLDPPASVVAILRSSPVETSALHRPPGTVLWRERSPVSLSWARPLPSIASAGNLQAPTQRSDPHVNVLSAIAEAPPVVSRLVVVLRDEPAKPLSRKVRQRSCHSPIIPRMEPLWN